MLLVQFEISGHVGRDVEALRDVQASKVMLTNSALSLKTLGVPLIHYCFTKLKLHGLKKVVLNVADNMPALYAGMKLGYKLEHNFSSKKLISIIDIYNRDRAY